MQYPCSVSSFTASRLNSFVYARRFLLTLEPPHEEFTRICEPPLFVAKFMFAVAVADPTLIAFLIASSTTDSLNGEMPSAM